MNSPSQPTPITLDVDSAVRERYSRSAQEQSAELCCPVDYNPRFLEAIPEEVLVKDYGCGDPSRHLRPGETVVDLGSGTGKICFIASQVVGPEGRIIGVDVNDDMLEVARRNQPQVARNVGHDNVHFVKGRIQDLQLDLDALGRLLEQNPVGGTSDYLAMDGEIRRLRSEEPLVATDSADVVISNCVLNLVTPEDKEQLFREIFRVLKRGGRAVISDIVSDEDVPVHLQNDPTLWTGCVSGAFREDRFLEAFEVAGFHGVRIEERGADPWATVEGIEFRSVTVVAYKGKQGPCIEKNQAVIYQGPWKEVRDDDGHLLRRGERMAVCEKTFHLYQQEPYGDSIVAVPPREPVPADVNELYDCERSTLRHPRETKGHEYTETKTCEPGESCC